MAKKSAKSSKKKAQPSFTRQKVWTWLIGLGPLLGLAGLTVLASFGELPDTDTLANPKTDLATRVFTTDGKLIGRYYSENRADARYGELPTNLVDALISTEDARFAESWVLVFSPLPLQLRHTLVLLLVSSSSSGSNLLFGLRDSRSGRLRLRTLTSPLSALHGGHFGGLHFCCGRSHPRRTLGSLQRSRILLELLAR